MKQLLKLQRDLAYLAKCLQATYLSLRGYTVVYTCFINGRYMYEYVTDFKKSFGIIVLGSINTNNSRHFADGIIELTKVPNATVNHSIHTIKY